MIQGLQVGWVEDDIAIGFDICLQVSWRCGLQQTSDFNNYLYKVIDQRR
jgi:hypothetical protein